MKVFWYLEFETIILTFQDGVGGLVAEYMIEPAQYLARITVIYNHVLKPFPMNLTLKVHMLSSYHTKNL